MYQLLGISLSHLQGCSVMLHFEVGHRRDGGAAAVGVVPHGACITQVKSKVLSASLSMNGVLSWWCVHCEPKLDHSHELHLAKEWPPWVHACSETSAPTCGYGVCCGVCTFVCVCVLWCVWCVFEQVPGTIDQPHQHCLSFCCHSLGLLHHFLEAVFGHARLHRVHVVRGTTVVEIQENQSINQPSILIHPCLLARWLRHCAQVYLCVACTCAAARSLCRAVVCCGACGRTSPWRMGQRRCLKRRTAEPHLQP